MGATLSRTAFALVYDKEVGGDSRAWVSAKAAPGALAATPTTAPEVHSIAFPVREDVWYQDDFAGVRDHHGNDLMGDKLDHLLAADSGRISWIRTGTPRAGNMLSLVADDDKQAIVERGVQGIQNGVWAQRGVGRHGGIYVGHGAMVSATAFVRVVFAPAPASRSPAERAAATRLRAGAISGSGRKPRAVLPMKLARRFSGAYPWMPAPTAMPAIHAPSAVSPAATSHAAATRLFHRLP